MKIALNEKHDTAMEQLGTEMTKASDNELEALAKSMNLNCKKENDEIKSTLLEEY